jgi:hypothetical protein
MKLADNGSVIYNSHGEWHEGAPTKGTGDWLTPKGPLGWLAPKGPETVAPGKRSAARGKACRQFKSPGRATDIPVALPGLTTLTARTPGCASLARNYSLCALPGRGLVTIIQTQVYQFPKLLTNAGTAEHSRVSPREAVVCPNGIGTGSLDHLLSEVQK